MNKKGIGSIIAYILLILLTIVGAAIIIGAVMRGVGNSTDSDSASCLNVDLKLNSCVIIPLYVVNTFFPGEPGISILLNVERFPGGKEVKGIRFAVTDTLGNVHLEEPVNLKIGEIFDVDTNYSDFREYESDDALIRNVTLYTPASIAVSAVVGGSETICPATRPAINCIVYGTTP
jgi:hypothetical protein